MSSLDMSECVEGGEGGRGGKLLVSSLDLLLLKCWVLGNRSNIFPLLIRKKISGRDVMVCVLARFMFSQAGRLLVSLSPAFFLSYVIPCAEPLAVCFVNGWLIGSVFACLAPFFLSLAGRIPCWNFFLGLIICVELFVVGRGWIFR